MSAWWLDIFITVQMIRLQYDETFTETRVHGLVTKMLFSDVQGTDDGIVNVSKYRPQV